MSLTGKTFSLWTQHGALNSKPVFDAFRQGCRALGATAIENSNRSDVDVIWSVLWSGRMSPNKIIWDRNQQSGKPTIVLEVGGISRGNTWKVGFNGINKSGCMLTTSNDSTRATQLGLVLEPWKLTGDHILVCGQHNNSQQWQHMPEISQWAMNIIEELQSITSRPIVFRPHPRCSLPNIEHQFRNVTRQRPQKINGTYDNFDLQFENARATVSWSSNPGIHSVIHGVAAHTGPDSIAFDVSVKDLHNIETVCLPDRQQWLNDYAWTEFTIGEISSGIPIKRLTNYL